MHVIYIYVFGIQGPIDWNPLLTGKIGRCPTWGTVADWQNHAAWGLSSLCLRVWWLTLGPCTCWRNPSPRTSVKVTCYFFEILHGIYIYNVTVCECLRISLMSFSRIYKLDLCKVSVIKYIMQYCLTWSFFLGHFTRGEHRTSPVGTEKRPQGSLR